MVSKRQLRAKDHVIDKTYGSKVRKLMRVYQLYKEKTRFINIHTYAIAQIKVVSYICFMYASMHYACTCLDVQL